MPRKAWATQDNISERLILEDLYVVQRFTAEAVAEELGWAPRTVYHRLAFHGLTPGNRRPKYCKDCGQVVRRKLIPSFFDCQGKMRKFLPSQTDVQDLLSSLGKEIRKRRTGLGLSQREFAARCFVERGYLSDIESGKRNISIGSFFLLARGFEMRASELLLIAAPGLAKERESGTKRPAVAKKKTKAIETEERTTLNNRMNRRIWKTDDSLHERKQLKKLYLDQGLAADEVAIKMGWSERTVYDRLHFHGLLPGYTAPNYCDCCGQVMNKTG